METLNDVVLFLPAETGRDGEKNTPPEQVVGDRICSFFIGDLRSVIFLECPRSSPVVSSALPNQTGDVVVDVQSVIGENDVAGIWTTGRDPASSHRSARFPRRSLIRIGGDQEPSRISGWIDDL